MGDGMVRHLESLGDPLSRVRVFQPTRMAHIIATRESFDLS